MIAIVDQAAPELGVASACDAIGLSRATYYRKRHGDFIGPRPRRKSTRALSAKERQTVLDTLHEERFVDLPPAEVYAQLLDENRYLCSVRTMYRILADSNEVHERRRQRTHPANAKPELCATAPNQVWTWDITKLPGPKKWTYFYLYVIVDIFSRYVVGWLIADKESAALAQLLLTETCARQGVVPDSLTLHQDRGSPMTSSDHRAVFRSEWDPRPFVRLLCRLSDHFVVAPRHGDVDGIVWAYEENQLSSGFHGHLLLAACCM